MTTISIEAQVSTDQLLRAALTELARLRGTTLDALMATLGITPPAYV